MLRKLAVNTAGLQGDMDVSDVCCGYHFGLFFLKRNQDQTNIFGGFHYLKTRMCCLRLPSPTVPWFVFGKQRQDGLILNGPLFDTHSCAQQTRDLASVPLPPQLATNSELNHDQVAVTVTHLLIKMKAMFARHAWTCSCARACFVHRVVGL